YYSSLVFFFSSRRRHTSSKRDWSSDVCSSDLVDKDHLHNHLIFNAVSFVDYKKYHSNKQSYHFIRRTSDKICKEHGLSVVVPGQDKGKSFAEYAAEKQGTSYKAKLKTAKIGRAHV